MTKPIHARCWAGMLLAGVTASSLAEVPAVDLADLSLEQLSEVVVTSVSRRHERLADAAASVYVIRREDIRRSGAASLAEALRLAPNLQVARVNATSYAITARGGNSTTANKLLVMIDGRTVYTPLYSGVFWDAQGVMLSDVERIEVISGPGATLWGANAVNGVINVITRNAADTQGPAAELAVGQRDRYAAARSGGTLGNGGHFRVYGLAAEYGPTRNAAGVRRNDRGLRAQAGLRIDRDEGAYSYSVQSELYKGRSDQLSGAADVRFSGAHLLGRLNRRLADGGNLTLQSYLDYTERDIPQAGSQQLATFDVEFQHALAPEGGHQLMWGAGLRHTRDRVSNSSVLAFLPADAGRSQGHVFVQDQWTLNPQLALTAGLKLERNPYTGTEYLPNLRLTWRMSEQTLLWGALSRAVRAPSRIDREFFLPGTPPHVALSGGPAFRSEIARVAELGYRGQLSSTFGYSFTLFHHDYHRLRSYEPTAGTARFENRIAGTTTGIETWARYALTRDLQLNAGLTAMDVRRRLRPDSRDPGIGLRALGNDPEITARLDLAWRLSQRGDVGIGLRHVGRLPTPAVAGYTVVDARVGWRVSPELELALVAENLFDRRHAEWANGAQVGRNLMVRLLWRN